MNKILVDQIQTVFPKVQTQKKEGEVDGLLLFNYPFEGVSVKVGDRAISVDFSNFNSIDFELIKLYFIDRLKFDKTALYHYNDKKILNIYFQRKFYSSSKELEEAMWRYGLLKSVISELEKFETHLQRRRE